MLTLREIDVVRLNTVASHVKSAYRKLEVHTAAGAVMRAIELELLLQPGHDLRNAG